MLPTAEESLSTVLSQNESKHFFFFSSLLLTQTLAPEHRRVLEVEGVILKEEAVVHMRTVVLIDPMNFRSLSLSLSLLVIVPPMSDVRFGVNRSEPTPRDDEMFFKQSGLGGDEVAKEE